MDGEETFSAFVTEGITSWKLHAVMNITLLKGTSGGSAADHGIRQMCH